MKDSAILIIASDNYLPHAKALMVNCVRQGKWADDFCLMCPSGCDTSCIEGRGIEIVRAPESHWSNIIKCRIFDSQFRRWQRLLYLDCDILIQGNLNDTCAELAKRFPAILCDGPQLSSILDDWVHFDELGGTGRDSHPEVYERLRERFPHIDSQILTADAMFFDPATIPDSTVDDLFAIQAEFVEANPGGYDQQVINLLLYDRLRPMTKDHCCWWAFDDPGNRVPNKERGWRGDEEPTILHYWNMYAPWLEKTPDAGAYFNHRLNRVCHELYQENLAAFKEVFPCLTK